ncbi:MAG TPA: peroxiredoxin-like family protein [Solirubrobacteraceae bacterium]|nr:peroxiredoxin-like family protein [Solirubrobacteraceae bacterium]
MQLHRARGQLEEAGGRVVLIGQATPRHAAQFRRRQGIQLPVLADEDRVSYRAAGAKVGGVMDLFNPKVVAKGALTGLREKTVQGRTIGDPAQLGGALVIRPDGQITWSHMSADAGDNASPEEIAAALREATA